MRTSGFARSGVRASLDCHWRQELSTSGTSEDPLVYPVRHAHTGLIIAKSQGVAQAAQPNLYYSEGYTFPPEPARFAPRPPRFGTCVYIKCAAAHLVYTHLTEPALKPATEIINRLMADL